MTGKGPDAHDIRDAIAVGEQSDTLQDVRDRVADRDIGLVRRDGLSALDSISRVTGKPLTAIPASPKGLREALTSATAPAFGLSAKRFANICSAALRAIRAHAIQMPSLTKITPLSPAWGTLLDRIQDSERRFGLKRIARLCSAIAVPPTEITSDTLLEFYREVSQDDTLKDPRKTLNQTICAWNWCERNIAGWPKYRLGSPFKSKHFILPLESFPQGFQTDIKAWQARVLDTGSLVFDGPARKHRPVTVQAQTKTILRFASRVEKDRLVPLTSLRRLSDLVDPKVVKAGLQAMDRHGNKVPYIRNAASLLLALAKYQCGLPQRQIEQLNGFVARLPRQRGMTAKNKQLLTQLMTSGVPNKIYDFPDALRRRAHRISNPVRRAHAYELALFADILLWASLRMQNMSNLRIDRNIRWENGICVLTFEDNEMKNRRPFEIELKDHVADALKTYLKNYRPGLPGARGPYLFPGKDGSPKHHTSLSNGFQTAMKKYSGVSFHPHFARHYSATLTLDGDATQLPLVSQKLGHASIETTRNFYLPNGTRAASQINNRLLEERLNRKLPTKPRKPKK